MSDISIKKQHTLGLEKARSGMKEWLAKAEKQHGLSCDYQEGSDCDTVTFKRSGVKGKATLTANEINVDANLGMLLKPMKSMLSTQIDSGITKFIEKENG